MGLFSFLLILFTVQRFPSTLSKPPDLFIAPPAQIQHFVFGYQEVTADLIWIRAIQDFDFCEKKVGDACRGQSWLYKMLVAVMDLSRGFRMPYAYGPIVLSIVISDEEGASKLFDRAVQVYSKDWSILYRAGYHALFEEKNNAKAAELMEKAARNGAPDWIYALATKLYTDAGKRDVGEALLEEMEASNLDPKIIDRMRDKLAGRKSPPPEH